MTPIIPSSTSNISLVPRPVFLTRNANCLSRSCISRKPYAQKLALPLSASVQLFPSIRTCILHRNARSQIISAAGTEVAIEEATTSVVDKESSEPTKTSAADVGPAKVQPRRSSASRKSEMPHVENEELVAGATFTGKVRSIQPFGAFIDFGAFTDGLVHVSRLSDSFVKDVGTIVSVGQEVRVRVVDVNLETRRISLTMRDTDDASKVSTDADRSRPPRKSGGQRPGQRREKVSKFSKGQNLVGTVKNINRSGAFITLPEGEEGFLPTSEEADGGLGSMMMDTGSSLDISQEVNVKVLKIVRGQVTLTMKKEDDMGVDSLLQGTVHTATNPFLLAFRQNKEIALFLDERENEVEPINNDELAPVANKDASPLAVATEESVDAVDQITEAAESKVLIESEEIGNTVVEEEVVIETPTVENEAAIDQVTEAAVTNNEIETEGVADNTVVKEEVAIDPPTAESETAVDQVTEAAVSKVEIESEGEVDNVVVSEKVSEKTSLESENSSSTLVEDQNMGPEESSTEESQISEVADNQKVKDEVQIETPTVAVDSNESLNKSNEQSSTLIHEENTAKAKQ